MRGKHANRNIWRPRRRMLSAHEAAAGSTGWSQVRCPDVQTQKKPDASPYVCEKVPPRTCSRNDRETPSKMERHNGPCWYISNQEQKSIFKLGGFSRTFAEITDEMNSDSDSRWAGMRSQNTIYTRSEKNQMVFCFF